MAQTFLETDFFLRRATPTPSRVPAQAASRIPFVVRDPDSSRAATPTRAQDARAESARRDLAGRTERARTQGLGTDRSESPDRSQVESSKVESSNAERQPARLQPTRDAPARGGRATAPANPGPSGATGGEAKAGPRDSAAAVTAPAAGAVRSPEAAVAGTILAGANPTGKTVSSETGAPDGTEEETDPAEASAEALAPSLLDVPVPPPLSTDPVLAPGPGQGGQASSPQGQAAVGSGQASAGQIQSPSGSVQPSEAHGPAAGPEAGRHPAAMVTGQPDPALAGKSEAGRSEAGKSEAGNSDPAVAVHESTGTAGAAAALALPEGLSSVRESFDAVLAGFSGVPAAAATPGASAAATQATQSPAPVVPSVPLGAVPMTIGLRSLQGSNHFEIRLDPGELGRINVSLDIDKERGTVMAHLVVDRIETLALLQRDAGSLQQALSQAGLDAPEANINLSLRSDTQAGDQGAENRGSDGRRPEGRSGGPGQSHQSENRTVLDAIPVRTLRGLAGLDIRI